MQWVYQLARSELLSVAVKCIACLSLYVPSTHLDKRCSSLQHMPEKDFFSVFFTTHKLKETTVEKCSTFCTRLDAKPTLRAFSSASELL